MELDFLNQSVEAVLDDKYSTALKRRSIDCVKDILNMSAEEFLSLRELDKDFPEIIIERLVRGDVPHGCIAHLYIAIKESDEVIYNNFIGVDGDTTVTELCERGLINCRIRGALHCNGVFTLNDLKNCSYVEVAHFSRLGSRDFNLLQYFMQINGVFFSKPIYPVELLKYKIRDLRIGVPTYMSFRDIGVETIEDVINLTGDEFINIKGVDRQAANQFLDCIKELGVPKYFLIHLYWALEEDMLVDERTSIDECQ